MKRTIILVAALAALSGCEHYPTMAELEAEERQLLRQIAEEDRRMEPRAAPPVEHGMPANTSSEIRDRIKAREGQKSPATAPIASKWGAGWESFGDWHVKALHDDMDIVTHVRLFTEFTLSEKPSPYVASIKKDLAFGLSIFGGSLVTTSHSLNLGGRDYWPYCDNDLSSASIDGGRAVQVATIPAGGSCNRVDANGPLISQFKAGQSAKLRVSSDNGVISLKGFSAAWDRARQLSQRPHE